MVWVHEDFDPSLPPHWVAVRELTARNVFYADYRDADPGATKEPISVDRHRFYAGWNNYLVTVRNPR
jgi:hypothetical protein